MSFDKVKNIVFIVGILIILGLFFFLGYKAKGRWDPCPVAKTDTIEIHDTIDHEIPVPYYTHHIDSVKYKDPDWMDSVIKANKIDTAALLADYYAEHYYTRNWLGIEEKDTLLSVTLEDMITRNQAFPVKFSYRILRPQTIIQNTTNEYKYDSYIYVGINFPMKDIEYADFNLLYAFSRGYAGFGYNPQLKSFSLHGGYRIARIGQK